MTKRKVNGRRAHAYACSCSIVLPDPNLGVLFLGVRLCWSAWTTFLLLEPGSYLGKIECGQLTADFCCRLSNFVRSIEFFCVLWGKEARKGPFERYATRAGGWRCGASKSHASFIGLIAARACALLHGHYALPPQPRVRAAPRRMAGACPPLIALFLRAGPESSDAALCFLRRMAFDSKGRPLQTGGSALTVVSAIFFRVAAQHLALVAADGAFYFRFGARSARLSGLVEGHSPRLLLNTAPAASITTKLALQTAIWRTSGTTLENSLGFMLDRAYNIASR